MTKAGTVKETGARADDVLVGMEDMNRNLQIRVDRDQGAEKGGRVEGSFELLDAGTGTYSHYITEFVGRRYRSAEELIRQIASRPGAAKVRHVLNRNALRVTVSTATEVGWFNLAVSYLRAARALAGAKVRSTHAELPLRFLCYHAIELFLKSYLVLRGCGEAKLRKLGHKVKDLAREAVQSGLHFDDEDDEVIELMAEGSTVIDSRYLKLGLARVPSIEALDRTAASLLDSVRTALRDAGHKVR